MELTTSQIYALFAMITAVIVLVGISYCSGLRIGRHAADHLINKLEKINAATSKNLAKRTADLIETNRLLDDREAALSKLRQSLRDEQRDHGEVERGLLNRLAAACPLSDEDQAVLLAIATKLGLAADTFAGLNAPDHAHSARRLQAQARDMAARIGKAQADTVQGNYITGIAA